MRKLVAAAFAAMMVLGSLVGCEARINRHDNEHEGVRAGVDAGNHSVGMHAGVGDEEVGVKASHKSYK